uniref:Uncharacterized protein n=1 Tax=Amphimedon queenslandica TaxID=400682 RepID=A0A1X7UZI5_AMPQE
MHCMSDVRPLALLDQFPAFNQTFIAFINKVRLHPFEQSNTDDSSHCCIHSLRISTAGKDGQAAIFSIFLLHQIFRLHGLRKSTQRRRRCDFH